MQTFNPQQGTYLGRDVKIVFNYDTSCCYIGTCVRDDKEQPFLTFFKMDNGEFVEAGECQYSPMD